MQNMAFTIEHMIRTVKRKTHILTLTLLHSPNLSRVIYLTYWCEGEE